MMQFIQPFKKLFATRCKLCALELCFEDAPLCLGCIQDLPWTDSPDSSPLTALAHVNVYSALYYDDPVDKMIHAFKHKQRLELLPIFDAALQTLALPAFDAILPVPLSKERLAMRGFNQSLILAKTVAKHHKKPIWQGMVRSRHTLKQQSLGRSERLENLRGAFTLTSKTLPTRILLVDDVLTTGSTLNEIAFTLKQYGVQQVSAVTVATAKLGR